MFILATRIGKFPYYLRADFYGQDFNVELEGLQENATEFSSEQEATHVRRIAERYSDYDFSPINKDDINALLKTLSHEAEQKRKEKRKAKRASKEEAQIETAEKNNRDEAGIQSRA